MLNELAGAVCSIVRTERRRYFWAAWWTEAPARSPFRKPDASNGGARSFEEALRAAELASGRTLSVVPPHWARAWKRILRGDAPFTPLELRAAETSPSPRRARGPSISASSVLGVDPNVTAEELKRAYRKRALETHPDRGGDPETFRLVQQSYERLVARRGKPRRNAR